METKNYQRHYTRFSIPILWRFYYSSAPRIFLSLNTCSISTVNCISRHTDNVHTSCIPSTPCRHAWKTRWLIAPFQLSHSLHKDFQAETLATKKKKWSCNLALLAREYVVWSLEGPKLWWICFPPNSLKLRDQNTQTKPNQNTPSPAFTNLKLRTKELQHSVSY